jgi:hypothetical protein
MTTQYVSHQGTSFTLTLNFDSSVANAPTDASLVNSNNTSGSVFIADMEKVADFFTSHYTNAVSAPVTINVGYGEIAGSGLGGGALGESESFYTQVAYSTLQSKFQSASLPGSDIGSGSHQYWVTTAEAKGLGITVLNGTNPDGYVGFSGAANTFDFTPGTAHGSGKYDFIGVAAHEISEVLGRATLNGAKDFGGGYADYSTLDLFHWSDNSSPPSHTFSASAAGYFSLDGSTSANEGYKEFNTNSLGDASDWQQISGSSDAYDWAGGLSMNSPVSYADYLVMEAAGWMGNLPGSTPTTWSWDGV